MQGDLGRGHAQEMACPGRGVSRWHCGIAATTADVAGVVEETKCWLQRAVEGTFWCPCILPPKSGKALERHDTELALQLYSRPDLSSFVIYMYIHFNFGGRGEYGMLRTWVGGEIRVTRGH